MKTIGVLGGIGPQATMDFESRVHRTAQQRIAPQRNAGYPPMVVMYLRHAPVLVDKNGAPLLPRQPDPRLLDAARTLGAICDFIVITSNGGHIFQPDIERASGKRVLSMIDATLNEVQHRGWRKVGVLGLGEPIVYTGPLCERGLACEIIDGDLRAELDNAIFGVMEGRASADTTDAATRAIESLRAKSVDGIILGCTEIPFLLDSAGKLDLINPIQFLAEAAVHESLKTD